MAGFRVALGIGVATMLALALLGLFPLAVVAGAVLVPVVTLLYLVDVDVYEGEPLLVIVLTLAWGMGSGVLVGILGRSWASPGAALLGGSRTHLALVRGVALPLIGLSLALTGPLLLLARPRYNDVLDGATFGATSGAAMAGAAVLTQASPMFSAGLRPLGDVAAWVIRVLELGVILPVLSMAAVGMAAAPFWLRWRAPVHDRTALGLLGQPWAGLLAAALLVVGAALEQSYLHPASVISLVILAILAAAALLYLRQIIHVGLLEEAAELPIGPAIICPNCGARTPHHSFCANCGVALRALPKARPASPEAPSS